MKSSVLLVRHGKPTMRMTQRFWKLIESGTWNERMHAYDEAGLDRDWNSALKERNQRIWEEFTDSHVLSSDLPRALETAHLLFGSDRQIQVDPLFREVPLPRFQRNIKLPMGVMITISRLGWYYGSMQGAEARAESMRRVERAVETLLETSRQKMRITLVSHGFFLWLVGRQLRRLGYASPQRGPYKYLEPRVFTK